MNTQCLSQACRYSTCWGPCGALRNEQCGAGLRCYENVHYVTTQLNDPVGPYMGLAGCLPSRGSDANCESAPCPLGEVCTLQTDASGTGWHMRCRDEVGEGRAGAACETDIQCRSNHCVSEGYCIEPCTDDENCVEAAACRVILLPPMEWKQPSINRSIGQRMCLPRTLIAYICIAGLSVSCSGPPPEIIEAKLPTQTDDLSGPYVVSVETWGDVSQISLKWRLDDMDDSEANVTTLRQVRPNHWSGEMPGVGRSAAVHMTLTAKGPGGKEPLSQPWRTHFLSGESTRWL